MTIPRRTRTSLAAAIFTFFCLSMTACGPQADGNDPAEEEEDPQTPDCGPNGEWLVEHGHCHCDDGFQIQIGTQCVPIDEEEPAEPEAPQESALPLSCSAVPVDCNPTTSEGCEPGHTCDIGESTGDLVLVCYPPPNDAPVGSTCNNQNGPFCEPGAWCSNAGTCQKVCCEDSECGDGERCAGIFTNPAFGSLGTCQSGDAPQCLPAGATCSPSNDQCCGVCHFDHCD